MKIKRIELKNFKRFTHLVIDDIPESAKLIVLVGPNGSGKTSIMEAMNHFYKYSGYQDVGSYQYLSKGGSSQQFDRNEWYNRASQLVNIEFYDATFPNAIGRGDIKGHFYFRSAYRNEPDFEITTMQRQSDPTSVVRLSTLMQNDQTVSSNYQRLVASTISGVFNSDNNQKSVETLREELTGQVRTAIERVFDDLKFSSLGEPLNNGSFFFTKGATKDFHYKNLSAGEKAAFDLILDMVVQSKYYQNAVYCIDEPETYMHTKLQGSILRELYRLIPGNSQLWLSTHSIGMLQAAEDIDKEHPGTVAFLSFAELDFDVDQIIRPNKIGKAALEKFYELAFGDFSKLILPKQIVFCEGDSNGKSRKDFDKTIYSTIFGETHSDAFFISGGSCNEIENIETRLGEIMSKLLSGTDVIKVIDRDDRNVQEIEQLSKKGIRVLSKRNLESYLLDNTIIQKLCDKVGQSYKYQECEKAKIAAMNNSIGQGNPSDDLKSARGEIYNSLKRILNLTQCGNSADIFLRDMMAPLITPDTEIYQELESDIFGVIT